MPSEHAILSPSSAKRWMACTPSARLESEVPDTGSVFSREGTIAHGVAETLLKFYLRHDFRCCADDITVNMDQNGLQELLEPLKTQLIAEGQTERDFVNMIYCVHDNYVRLVYEDYLEACQKDHDAILLVEQKYKLSKYIKGGFGTSDAVLIYSGTCRVYDLKYGKGVKVDADENPQMMCYGLGAYLGQCELYDTNRVEMVIIQPRLGHVSTWGLSAASLLQWAAEQLKPKADLAYEGAGDFKPGDHCQFCKIAGRCKALKAYTDATITRHTNVELMTPQEQAEALNELVAVKLYVKSLEEFTLNAALNGTIIPGYKVVEGTSRRQITDQESAYRNLLGAGLDPEVILKPRELLGLTDLQKVVTKKAFNDLVGPFITKPAGKPTLVPMSDKRPPFNPLQSDFNEL